MESSSLKAEAEAPQYHHFIPRFILRSFAHDFDEKNEQIRQSQNSKKQRNKRKRKSKIGSLRFIHTETGLRDESLLSRHYGLENMYRDIRATNQDGLEKKLAFLETKTSLIFAKARIAFELPDGVLVLNRPEKDILRRFLFLMMYRNGVFYSRFNVATIENYAADDKEKMRDYMLSHGFQSPRDVWLSNMHAFLDLDLDLHGRWRTKILHLAYPNDAELFISHLDQSYLAFCRPRDIKDEILISDNAFGIFEGPTSLVKNRATGELKHAVRTEWHNFAPVTPSLLIVLRSNYLPGGPNLPDDPAAGMGTMDRDAIYQTLRMMHPDPAKVGSILQDLPISRCRTSYTNLENDQITFIPGYQGPSEHDTYTFRCFELDSPQVHTLNNLFLEEAMNAHSVVYKSDHAAARAIKTYLESTQSGLKCIYGTGHPRARYLKSLEIALQQFNVKANTISTIYTSSREAKHSPDCARNLARWGSFDTALEIPEYHPQLLRYSRFLGDSINIVERNETHKSMAKKNSAPVRNLSHWVTDFKQAGLILFMHIIFETALSQISMSRNDWLRCKLFRQRFFASLRPRIIWIYIKASRNLDKFDIKDVPKCIEPL